MNARAQLFVQARFGVVQIGIGNRRPREPQFNATSIDILRSQRGIKRPHFVTHGYSS